MSKHSAQQPPSQHGETTPSTDQPSTPPDAVDEASHSTVSKATPRGRRRRVDPDGETLATGAVPPSTSATPSSTPPAKEPVADTKPVATVPPTAQQPLAQSGSTIPPATLPTAPLEDSFVDATAARARARDRAAVGSPTLARVLQVVLAILAPLVIFIGIIRLVASPLFLWFEYNRPGFPADQYGMDPEQRMTLGSYGMDYLFNFAPPAYLGDLTFANGNPVFTDAEVGHMVDVKRVMGFTMLGGVLAAIICVIAIIMLYRMRKGAIARALFAGAVWFTAAIIVLAIVAALGWEAFFAGFHQLFFADGTWTFLPTDSLIRLYPGQFWIDAAAWIAGLTLAMMTIMLACTAPTGRRRYRNAQAQRFMESQVTGQSNPEAAATTGP